MSGEQTVNIPLLRKAVEWAEAEAAKPAIDREWIQDSWLSSPSTVATDALEGTPADDLDMVEYERLRASVATHCGTAYCIAGYVAQSVDARYATETVVDGVHAADLAREALGLSSEQANSYMGGLFYGDNTIADVRRIAEEIAGERL